MRTLGGVRPGTALVELLVALVLFGIVGAATLRSLDRQARFHHGLLAILESRSQHAATHEAVAIELRGLSPASGDITRLSDSAVVFRLPVGTGLACAIGASWADLAPDSTSAGQGFARFRTAPQPGDSAWVFDEGGTDTSVDDRWAGLRVVAATRSTGRCPGSPMIDPVLDVARLSWRFQFAGTIPSTVSAGAALRLTRTARFALYRGGTGESWLGFAEVNPTTGAWVTIQPVSGPYLPFSAGLPSGSGIALAARDSSGAAAVSPTAPAWVTLASRTRTTRTVRMDGLARGAYADSLHSLIGLRNAR